VLSWWREEKEKLAKEKKGRKEVEEGKRGLHRFQYPRHKLGGQRKGGGERNLVKAELNGFSAKKGQPLIEEKEKKVERGKIINLLLYIKGEKKKPKIELNRLS